MKATRKMQSLLAALLLVGLSLGAVSCSDDDDDNKNSEEQQQEQQEQATTFWNVVGQLTSISNYTPDYQDKTFEPTIGEPVEGNANVRVVYTNDMASAAERFASLVDVSTIDGNTASYEWKDDAVGTLSYQKTNNGQSWATVDVNIRQLPSLQQIIYRSPEQDGTNASITGTCYYRFGDVIKRDYDDYNKEDDIIYNRSEYWLCVRPAFGPEGKGDSHWITVSPLPSKNIWSYKDSKGRQHSLPTGIGHNTEQMQNLAEMLYALYDPADWQANVLGNPAPGLFSDGLRMFHDFSHDKYKVAYHSQYFWKRVRQAWEANNIYRALFGLDSKDFYTKMLNNPQGISGLNFLVDGYSWWYKTSWNMSLYQYTYKNGKDYKSNMHDVRGKTEVKNSMEVGIDPIDINMECSLEHPHIVNENFFGDNCPRYIIRHATGKELAGFKPSAYTTMANGQNGITDIYTYNQYYKVTVNNGNNPEMIYPQVFDIIGANGLFYKNERETQVAGTKPVAIVLYVGEDADAEASGKYHGLAMAMDITGRYQRNWGTNNNTVCTESTQGVESKWLKQLNGYELTKKLEDETHSHPAAEFAYNYQAENFNPARYGFSGWFLPTFGQLAKCVQGLGGYVIVKDGEGKYTINDSGHYDDNVSKVKNEYNINYLTDSFLTSTEYTGESVVLFNFDRKAEDIPTIVNKKDNYPAIPFFAF